MERTETATVTSTSWSVRRTARPRSRTSFSNTDGSAGKSLSIRPKPTRKSSARPGGIKANTTVGALLKAGVRPKGGWTLPEGDAALLVDLPWILADDKKGVDYFVGTPSFSAILHYNRSYFYAAAVSMLADEIRSREIAIEKARRPAEEPAVQTSDAPKAVQS